MKTLSMTARAKINLSLSVLGKREDGYHNIESLMQMVDFGDTVTVTHTKEPGIRISTNRPDLPTDVSNIAYRAATLMQERFGLSGGFTIHLEKQIPVAAGLAGGSTNAAAVMHLINRLCDLSLTSEKLAELGVTLGADVPFCIYGKAALCEGIGDILTPVTGLSGCYILLLNPGQKVSTAQIYKEIDAEPERVRPDVKKLISYLSEGKPMAAFPEMKNEMEAVARRHCPEIGDLLRRLKDAQADHCMMSGSGATCFGIFLQKPDEEKLKKIFGKEFIALTKPV